MQALAASCEPVFAMTGKEALQVIAQFGRPTKITGGGQFKKYLDNFKISWNFIFPEFYFSPKLQLFLFKPSGRLSRSRILIQVQCLNFQVCLKIQLWKWMGQRHRNSGLFPGSVIFVIGFLHLQDLMKVINNGFYSFSISRFVLELFRFVWYVNEINYDVKSHTDCCKLLEYMYIFRIIERKLVLFDFSVLRCI